MMEQVKDFAANVYEAFSTPQQLEKWTAQWGVHMIRSAQSCEYFIWWWIFSEWYKIINPCKKNVFWENPAPGFYSDRAHQT